MTDTEKLIEQLAGNLRPLRRPAALLSIALTAASVIAGSALLSSVGVRTDLGSAALQPMFWIKFVYCVAPALIGLVALRLLMRPEARVPGALGLIAVPVMLLGALSLAELSMLPRTEWLAAWLGASWRQCSITIVLTALPIGAALFVVARRFAPTKLRATGALIGVTAGGTAAAIYSLHCPEAGPSFVLTWYSLGIAAAALTGAALGPRLLHW